MNIDKLINNGVNMDVVNNIDNWLLWYCDEDIAIHFDKKPKHITIEYPPNATKEQIEDIDKKPYVLTEDLYVKIQYDNDTSYLFLPKGYRWNGADIPFGAWELIISPDDPKIRLASCIHDFACSNHRFCRDDRYLSTKLLTSLCKETGISNAKVFLIFHTVDNYQKLFGKDKYGKKWGYYKKNNLL